ncbi:hypothetical protein ASPWEDRAFT_167969 [Aspergillus wentii DTO 134E9]|uniref:Uncharacterized protein n=1 Tax=Aspergillus wentii DTO 134E9 TaxID=1073089 RepID=A0A1L9RSY4_ASPWE|nr:uncharacterized protein ASPWEDRAFT_167969 [Aspergillus wentii DTO 134E9]OJJ38035.1 hypothetical protein ASPWEDRAFT_167969 [Aspergillus wentii DTO 134E9]
MQQKPPRASLRCACDARVDLETPRPGAFKRVSLMDCVCVSGITTVVTCRALMKPTLKPSLRLVSPRQLSRSMGAQIAPLISFPPGETGMHVLGEQIAVDRGPPSLADGGMEQTDRTDDGTIALPPSLESSWLYQTGMSSEEVGFLELHDLTACCLAGHGELR